MVKSKWLNVGYGVHILHLCPGMRLSVIWSGRGYQADVFGRTVKTYYISKEEAKSTAEALAKVTLKAALASLP